MREEKKMSIPPRSIAIIPDGNRRFARRGGLFEHKGHLAGYEKFKEVVFWAREEGVRFLTFFALSTENWNSRGGEEISFLMNLFKTALLNALTEYKNEEIHVRFIGETYRLSPALQELMERAEGETRAPNAFEVVIAMLYGGRSEIVHALPESVKLINAGHKVTEEVFSNLLWTKDIPPPDMLIRSGGEKRISNFLLWNIAYTELFFTNTLWPDFSREEFGTMIKEFSTRKRRFGGNDIQ